MKKNNDSWISFALNGTGIGFPVTALCMLLIGGYNPVIHEILVWMIASALFGLASGLFFQKQNLNLLTATALHFVCCLGIASGAGWLCGYAESFLALLGGMLPVFVLVYAVVYLSIFCIMKREAERINKALDAE
jgi:uncharacterized membrane protein YfcA